MVWCVAIAPPFNGLILVAMVSMENAFSKYILIYTTPKKTHMGMRKKQPFDDVSPIKNGDVPLPFFGVSET